MTPHNIVRYADGLVDKVNVSAYINARMYVADQTHPNILKILDVLEGRQSLLEGEDEGGLVGLFDATDGVVARFRELTDRVSYMDGLIYFDGDPVVERLSSTIMRMVQGDEDFSPMVRFLENLMLNPNEHSRSMLFDWMVANRGFTITPDGHFIAYKGVTDRGTSLHAGPAIVNGNQMNGYIPNEIGSIITMPRGNVQFDSHVGCSVGLHVGVWEYAHSFGRGRTLKVKVNPRDVVSVPTDCSAQKMRVCRYEVLDIIHDPIYDVVDHTAVDDDYWGSPTDEAPEWYDEWVVVGSDGVTEYTVTEWAITADSCRLTCTCPSFQFSSVPIANRTCKHTR